MTSSADITQRILARCRELGFALAGVCDAKPTERERELLQWLRAGRHGEMGYLARHLDMRLDPATFVPGAKTIICVADRYSSPSPLPPAHTGRGGSFGRIARYARGKDYHRIMRDRLGKLSRDLSQLYPHERFRACVDTAPVLEREYAQRAGLGAIGKNTMLIERSVGSWLLLGEIITTLPLAVSRASDPDPCGGCTRCIDACPTKAIAVEGWSIDATRCISYLTIEHHSVIDERFHEAIGDWIFGCDICQEVCPHNEPKSQNRDAPVHAAYAPRQDGFDLLEMLNWSETDREQASINSALKRARLDMFRRNAIIAAGNTLRTHRNPALAGRIREIAASQDEPATVCDSARMVLRRLEPTG